MRLKHNSRTVKQLLLTQTKLKHREIPELKKQQVCLKTICIHSHSQLSEVLDIFSRKESVVLIARISPIAIKDSKAKIGLVNEIYKQATKNNYSVFRLGEERIIVVHNSVKVEGILTEILHFNSEITCEFIMNNKNKNKILIARKFTLLPQENIRRHTGHGLAMALHAGPQLARHRPAVQAGDHGQHSCCRVGHGSCVGNFKLRKILRDLQQVGIGQRVHQLRHQRVVPPPIGVVDELVVHSLRLARQSWVVAIRRGPHTVVGAAGGAGHGALGNGVSLKVRQAQGGLGSNPGEHRHEKDWRRPSAWVINRIIDIPSSCPKQTRGLGASDRSSQHSSQRSVTPEPPQNRHGGAGMSFGLASCVVRGLPATPHKPLLISWITQRVMGRKPSPPTLATASVSAPIKACFCSSDSTPSTIFTSMNGRSFLRQWLRRWRKGDAGHAVRAAGIAITQVDQKIGAVSPVGEKRPH